MNLVVLPPHFAPDVAPTGAVWTRIVTELANRGHRIEVITALPWYKDHRVEPGFEGRLVRKEQTEWGSVTRLHPFPTDKTDIPRRAAAFAGFSALAAAVGALGPKVDAVLAVSPPLTLGGVGWMVAKARRAPLVFNIQDVYPDVAIDLGALTNPKVIAASYKLELWSYHRADAVTVLSDDLRANLVDKVGPGQAHKIRVIPNFVDTELIRPMPAENSYRAEYALSGKRVVLYAGNVGMSQSLDLVLYAARALRAQHPDVMFVINGGGAALIGLREAAADLDNVRFVAMQPAERLPELLAAGDIHLVPLKRGLARASVPSKTYSILAAGRPLVASVDEGSEVARIVERAGAGIAVPPDDPEAFTAALGRLLASPDEAAAMGQRGRAWVEGWASPAAVAQSYEELFSELATARRRSVPPRG
ncbi:MAG: colanic acid biosynthesis glycosyl transferase WcaI [Actinomycetota bacterium]|nr:colanic acid biosynthesis glycosyl transferase WcaI [Actinomycetota bacterium]